MQYFVFLSNLFDKTSVVNACLARARAVGKFSRVCSLIIGCFLWLGSTAIGSTVLWTGTHDTRCGYPYHNCGTSSGHLYYNIHWAGVARGDNYYIFNDRGDLITIVGAVDTGSVVVDRGVFSMCDCLAGTYEALDALATRAGGYYYGDQLPVAGGDILTGVVTPGLSCTEGCPNSPTNVVTVDIYLGTAILPSYLNATTARKAATNAKVVEREWPAIAPIRCSPA